MDTSKSRKALTRTERFAAVILDLKIGTGEPFIDRERAKGMTAEDIVAEFEARTQDEHIVPVSIARDLGWPRTKINHPANMQIITPAEHAPKTKKDVTAIAKSKRISKEQEAFRQRLLRKDSLEPNVEETPTKPRAKIQSRGFSKLPKKDWKTGKIKEVSE